jgi:hypothetical protein
LQEPSFAFRIAKAEYETDAPAMWTVSPEIRVKEKMAHIFIERMLKKVLDRSWGLVILWA